MSNRRTRLGLALISTVVLTLSGLPAVAQSQLDGSLFVPPPRQATDLIEVLGKVTPEDQEKLDKLKAVADAAPPADADAVKLTQFFSRRGHAASLLGRNKQTVADYAMAAKHADAAEGLDMGLDEVTWYRWDHGLAHLAGGDIKKAIAMFEDAIGKVPFNTQIFSFAEGWLQGNSIAWYGMLAQAYSMLGDKSKTDEAMERAQDIESQSAQWPISQEFHDMFDNFVAS